MLVRKAKQDAKDSEILKVGLKRLNLEENSDGGLVCHVCIESDNPICLVEHNYRQTSYGEVDIAMAKLKVGLQKSEEKQREFVMIAMTVKILSNMQFQHRLKGIFQKNYLKAVVHFK